MNAVVRIIQIHRRAVGVFSDSFVKQNSMFYTCSLVCCLLVAHVTCTHMSHEQHCTQSTYSSVLSSFCLKETPQHVVSRLMSCCLLLVASVCEGILNLDLTLLCFLVLKKRGFSPIILIWGDFSFLDFSLVLLLPLLHM